MPVSMIPTDTYTLYSLGDTAVTIHFGDRIDASLNSMVMALFKHLAKKPLKGMTEVIPAYSSITICYDVLQAGKMATENHTAFDFIKKEIRDLLEGFEVGDALSKNLVKIPVCYENEFAPDTAWIAEQKNISINDVIQAHTEGLYRVYMIGFLPGFAYMGEVDEQIAVSRKAKPRQQVEKGSVGIAGRQTGIYSLSSPGGWQIIGRTPLKLFDAAKEYPVLLNPGDEVKFYSITRDQFFNFQ